MDLQAARSAGTPKGEGAKVVSRLSFQKIRGMQEELAASEAKLKEAMSRAANLQV
jgi:hypothetical protein